MGTKTDPPHDLLLRHNLKALRLPTMLSEYAKLSREAADADEDYHGYLLRLLTQLEKVDLLVIDELGYLSFSRSAAERLFQVFADRYERGSIPVTGKLPFGDWASLFQGERMTAALLDRFTHRCTIFEMNGESYRFRESAKTKGVRTAPESKTV